MKINISTVSHCIDGATQALNYEKCVGVNCNDVVEVCVYYFYICKFVHIFLLLLFQEAVSEFRAADPKASIFYSGGILKILGGSQKYRGIISAFDKKIMFDLKKVYL